MDSVTVDLQPTHNQATPSLHGHDKTLGVKTPLFRDPQDILAHLAMDASAKRAVLASWASDACAVENLPNWRRLPETGALVALDDILDALRALDGGMLH